MQVDATAAAGATTPASPFGLFAKRAPVVHTAHTDTSFEIIEEQTQLTRTTHKQVSRLRISTMRHDSVDTIGTTTAHKYARHNVYGHDYGGHI
jgi:hypothetical protein